MAENDVVPDQLNEEETREYLENLGTEYRSQCMHENDPEGCHRFADFLEAFRKDFEKARIFYQSNCDDNSYARSCFKIGNYKMLGRACSKDEEDALGYYKKGCELGHGPSCHNSALLHHLGKVGEEKDHIEAAGYLQKGCDKNHFSSCQLLSTYFITGKEGIEKNMAKACNLATKACEGGNINACVNLYQMYKKGEGVAQDNTQAEKFKIRAQELHGNKGKSAKQVFSTLK